MPNDADSLIEPDVDDPEEQPSDQDEQGDVAEAEAADADTVDASADVRSASCGYQLPPPPPPKPPPTEPPPPPLLLDGFVDAVAVAEASVGPAVANASVAGSTTS